MKKLIQIVGRAWNGEKVCNSCEIYDIKTVNLDKLVNEFTFLSGDTINVKGTIYTYEQVRPTGDSKFFGITYWDGEFCTYDNYALITDVKTKKTKKYVFHFNHDVNTASYRRVTGSAKIEMI